MSNPWTDWKLPQWLHHLEHRHQKEIQLGLARIREVALRLNLLKPACKVITITGTNGKGSTLTALEHIYHQAGFKVGAYTSPHLIAFNERIRLNLKWIDEERLCAIFSIIEEARGDIILTYFEMATLAALVYFSQQQVDIMLLEVGIGGRLDATNIIDADLAIITTVDFDHQGYLGHNLDDIGYEKAGILRKGIPFIYADENPPKSVINAATTLEVIPYFYGKDYSFIKQSQTFEIQAQQFSLSDLTIPKIQLKSAAAAIMACHALEPYLPVAPQAISCAMKSVFVSGRLQWVPGNPSLLYDVSHNPQSAKLLADYLKHAHPNTKIHAVFSALGDKDIAGIIAPLKNIVHSWYPAQLDSKRSASASFLLAELKNAGIIAEICYNDPLKAYEAAVSMALGDDLIVIFGSFHTVAEVMQANLL